jgi:hypothetical protein
MKHLIVAVVAFIIITGCNPLNKINFAAHQPFDESEISDEVRVDFNGTASFYVTSENKLTD